MTEKEKAIKAIDEIKESLRDTRRTDYTGFGIGDYLYINRRLFIIEDYIKTEEESDD